MAENKLITIMDLPKNTVPVRSLTRTQQDRDNKASRTKPVQC